jgi:hypothetical protein
MQQMNRFEGIRCYGEIFLAEDYHQHKGDSRLDPPRYFYEYQRGENGNCSAYLDYIASSGDDGFAFKLMYDQIRQYPSILFYIIRNRFKVIHVTRGNYFDIVTSRLISRNTGVYHSRNGMRPVTLRPDPQDVLRMMSRIDRNVRIANAALSILPLDVKSIRYEDLAKDPSAVLGEVGEFLGIPPENLLRSDKDWKKTNNRKAEDIYENYDSILNELKDTKYYSLVR